jgi:hypothetical protein
MLVTKQTKKREGGFLVKQSSKRSRFVPVELGKVDGTRAVLEAVPQAMTAFGGVSMLADVEKKVGIVAELSKLVHDNRLQHLVDHKKFDILLQRVCQIGTGYADGNDCDWLRRDAGILLGLGRDPVTGDPGASQETASRFEMQALDENNIKAAQEFFVNHFIASQKKRPKEVELDPDGTMIKTHGAQEGSVFRGGKYHHTMDFPLKIFCGDWLLATILRRGDQSEAKTIVDALKMVVGKLRAKWPRLRIKVRLDAGFGSPELYQWLRQERVVYEVGMASNPVLDLYTKAFKQQAEENFRKLFGEPRFIGKKGDTEAQEEHARIRGLPTEKRMEEETKWRQRRARIVGEFSYKPEKWKNWERVICRVDYTDKGFDIHYVVVSRQFGVPQRIYEEDYCKRGSTEQSIGRFKQTGQRLSAQDFTTNQFRLMLYGVAYMLLMHLHNYVAPKLRSADVNTLRKSLMLMPMLVQRTEKKMILQISETHAHCKEFLDAWRRLAAA